MTYLVHLDIHRGGSLFPRMKRDRIVQAESPLVAMRRAEDLENLCVEDNEYAAARRAKPIPHPVAAQIAVTHPEAAFAVAA